MKNFNSLTQQLEKWRQKYQDFCHFPSNQTTNSVTKSKQKATEEKSTLFCQIRKAHPPMMWGLAVVSLTSIVSYRFYNQPQLSVETVSPVTIYAPQDGHFEDSKTTEEKRKEIRTGVIPILKRDEETTQQIELNLRKILDQIEQIRQLARPFPFLDPKIIPLPIQNYLRSCSEAEWQTILKSVNTKSKQANYSLNPAGKKAIKELQNYHQPLTPAQVKQFQDALAKISLARQKYAQALAKGQERFDNLNTETQVAFLQLSEPTWQKTKNAILQVGEKILIQGIPPGIPENLLQETVTMHLNNYLSTETKPIATNLLMGILQEQHNLVEDKEQTKRRAEQAAKAVEPVIVKIKKGQVIVKAGEKISQEDFLLLDGFKLSRRRINWEGVGLSAILVTGSIAIFCFAARRVRRPLRRRDHLLLCLLSLSVPVLAIFNVRYTDLPALGLLVSSFYGPTLAATQVVLLTGLGAFATGTIAWEYWLAGAAGGLLAAIVAGQLRSRDELALLGAGVGLTQGGVYLVVTLIASTVAGTIWYAVLPGALFYGSLGVVWTVIALGISPYLERFFDLVTPIRLVELSNPNCPLLKRLSTEAPGTFQHTLFVASLAEAAARALHCNVELVRAGTLYHDIGKMHDPLAFIENQMGGPNKHEEINDPHQSAEIIKKHVSEGLVMARKYGLPKMVRDFIPEHQGRLLISYFYFQAQQEGKHPVLESDFRYDGPIPQSRETGIVMLADSCEAALRSLKDATPTEALAMIQKIFKARWQDNQLAESGINYEELPIIAEVFVRVWQQFNHQRIAYPKAVFDSRSSGK
jgi:putative nucleotidyltransferase with HDIG domain